MKLEDHMESTLMKIGEEHKDIHRALDDYFFEFRSSLHWVIFHHRLGIEKMIERFGGGARRAAEIHMRIPPNFFFNSWDTTFGCSMPMSMAQLGGKGASSAMCDWCIIPGKACIGSTFHTP